MRRLPILIPHRSGCADFPLPVLHGRASLVEVQMTPSVTCRQRTTRGRTSALVSILASSATRCRFVDRFVRLKVLSHVRGFGTCCLRFTNGVATIHAKLASGWLARLYREGVEPSGSLQKVSGHPSSFSGLC